jgi:potassium inwardly-rectifying channel subfamily J
LLIENSWRRILFLFVSAFLVSWTTFALVYSLIAWASGDFHDPHLESDRQYCIQNVNNFITAFLFSVESQHTIGYGYR